MAEKRECNKKKETSSLLVVNLPKKNDLGKKKRNGKIRSEFGLDRFAFRGVVHTNMNDR